MGIPSVFGLKGIAAALVIGAVIGAYAGYRVTNTFDEAKALRKERDDLKNEVEARNETIARNARLTAGVNDIAIRVNRAIAQLREADPDDTEPASGNPCSTYSDADFERVQQRIRRAAGAGLALYPSAGSGNLGAGGAAKAQP
ncbi:hypothetical protein [Kaistia sp. MMO-174]|uniref:hypothetical protein n=1 Tax=Kaistia sp. MMO-174 TaxID=3081256 RepID=UPI00301AAAC7